jgi:hypothetical protein
MSVVISVGWLDEMRQCDEDGFARYKKFFKNVTKMLRKRKLPTYAEPESLQGRGCWWQVFPENGIAHLQRLAVYLWQKDTWPAPGTEEMGNPLSDREIVFAYEDCYFQETTPNSKGQRFNHLVCLDCRNGWWLPVDFDTTIAEDGWQYGSSLRLKKELEDIAGMLKLSLDLDPKTQEVENMTRFGSRTSRTKWEKYGIEAFSCLLLHHAATASEKLGAAIHLH